MQPFFSCGVGDIRLDGGGRGDVGDYRGDRVVDRGGWVDGVVGRVKRPIRMLSIAVVVSLVLWWVLAKLGVVAYWEIRSW